MRSVSFSRSRRGRQQLLWWNGIACALGVYLAAVAVGQDIEQIEPPLIDQQPFDLITLTADEGGQSWKVAPLEFPGRKVPASVKPTDKLEVVLLRFPDRRYEVAWGDIAEIGIYEQRIYDEAVQKMREKDFVTAFQNLSFLRQNYPNMPQLEQLRQQFIFESAIDRFQNGELRQTLSALEELRETAPAFRREAVENALSNVADKLIGEYQQNGQLGAAQTLLNRLKEKYGANLAVVSIWDRRLEQMALNKRDEAVELMAQGKYREARKAASQMVSIFPDLKEAQALIEKINREHPMVLVGVMQRSGNLDPSSLVDWPARRAGQLVYQTLFQFLETGGEGGKYRFSLGSYRMSDDRLQLILSIDPSRQATMSSFELAQELVQRADPDNAAYDPSWAAIFDSVTARAANQVIVNLKRPNVLPHALLQWVMPDEPGRPGSLPGDYRVGTSEENEATFELREPKSTGQPVEIVEIFYDDPKAAVNDLLRGELDVVDQLYPADARRLASDQRVRIGSYALPTTHMLIPLSDDPYLSNTKFRRALLYATNREAMLTGELLNSSNLDDGRLISGPFPIGSGGNDPLAYAYNPEIEPTEYSPQLARLLIVMTKQELEKRAEKLKEPPPEMKKLVVGCPDFEFARVAVQAMIQQWAIVGIEAEMQILPAGKIGQEAHCDLLYVVTTMWEPATDIERLLGGNGIAASDNPFIVLSLEKLRAARNWREVRKAMQDMHQLVDYHLPVLPLWQVTDRFAVRRDLEGMDKSPVSLYQSVSNWRIMQPETRTANRP